MDQDTTWYGGIGVGPGEIVLDGNSAPPTERGTAAPPPLFGLSTVTKRSPISATAELLFKIFAMKAQKFKNIYLNELQEFLTCKFLMRCGPLPLCRNSVTCDDWV